MKLSLFAVATVASSLPIVAAGPTPPPHTEVCLGSTFEYCLMMLGCDPMMYGCCGCHNHIIKQCSQRCNKKVPKYVYWECPEKVSPAVS